MAKLLGRYEVVGILGQGGMGQVFLGFDPVLERYVAIKQIMRSVLAHEENETLLAYFQREARVIASLQHPNIIQIYEYGNPLGEPAYIVTEFVDGMTFEELVEDLGSLPPVAAVTLLQPVAEALDFAHSRGIIHRDLKPGNVMLSRHGRVFLMDFGLAKSIATDGLKSMIIGSPAFMAPEQIEGATMNERTDVFSFGVLAYAVSTGELLFSMTAAKAFGEILSDDYPSVASLERVPNLGLRTLIGECVRRRPENRLPSMGMVVERLDEILMEYGVGSAGRAARHWASHWGDLMPQQFSAGVGTNLRVNDTTPAGRTFWSPTENELASAIPPGPVVEFGPEMEASDGLEKEVRPRSQGDTCVTELAVEPALNQESTGAPPAEASAASTPLNQPASSSSSLAPTPEVTSTPVEDETASSHAEPSPTDRPAQPPAQESEGKEQSAPEMSALVVSDSAGPARDMEVVDSEPFTPNLGAVMETQKDATTARWIIAVLLTAGGTATFENLRRLLAELRLEVDWPQVAQSLVALVNAGILVQRGDDQLSIEKRVSGEGLWSDFHTAELPLEHLLEVLVREAQRAEDMFEIELAIEWLDRAGGLCAQMHDLPTEVGLDVLIRRADLALYRCDHEMARELYEDVLALPNKQPELELRARHGLSRVWLLQARLTYAEREVQSGTQLSRRVGVERGLASFRRLQGEIHLRSGRLREALVTLKLAAGADDDHGRALNAMLRGQSLFWLGRYTEAGYALDTASETFDACGDVGSVAEALLARARMALQLGCFDEAEQFLDRAWGNAKPSGARLTQAGIRRTRAELLRWRGDVEEARRWARRALAEFEALRIPRRILRAQTTLASVLCDAGEWEEADRLLAAARAALQSDPLCRFTVLTVQARLEVGRGDLEGAREAAAQAYTLVCQHDIIAPFTCCVYAYTLDRLGDEQSAAVKEFADSQYESGRNDVRRAMHKQELARWESGIIRE